MSHQGMSQALSETADLGELGGLTTWTVMECPHFPGHLCEATMVAR